MPRFTSIDEILKYVTSNIDKVVLSTGATLPQIIESEADRLADLIKRKLGEYYMSYDPKVYKRTYDLMNSIRIEKSITKGSEISVRVYFDESATKKSLFGGEDGFTPWLINHGWQVKNGWHAGIEHFGYQDGARFIEYAIAEWEKTNKYGLKIRINVDVPGVKRNFDYTGGDIN